VYWPGQLARLALKVLKRIDSDFMVVISPNLQLDGTLSKQHNKSDAKKSPQHTQLQSENGARAVTFVIGDRMTDLW
jgi:hypothetical protein